MSETKRFNKDLANRLEKARRSKKKSEAQKHGTHYNDLDSNILNEIKLAKNWMKKHYFKNFIGNPETDKIIGLYSELREMFMPKSEDAGPLCIYSLYITDVYLKDKGQDEDLSEKIKQSMGIVTLNYNEDLKKSIDSRRSREKDIDKIESNIENNVKRELDKIKKIYEMSGYEDSIPLDISQEVLKIYYKTAEYRFCQENPRTVYDLFTFSNATSILLDKRKDIDSPAKAKKILQYLNNNFDKDLLRISMMNIWSPQFLRYLKE